MAARWEGVEPDLPPKAGLSVSAEFSNILVRDSSGGSSDPSHGYGPPWIVL